MTSGNIMPDAGDPDYPVSPRRKRDVIRKRDVNSAIKANKAIELRAQRLTYREIAELVGYAHPAAAYDAIQRELQNQTQGSVEYLRHEESDMLNRLHQVAYKIVMDETKTDGARLFAIDRCLTISERRCKLLGLDSKSEETMTAAVLIREVHANLAQL